jgi:hypothetical protein
MSIILRENRIHIYALSVYNNFTLPSNNKSVFCQITPLHTHLNGMMWKTSWFSFNVGVKLILVQL